MKSVFEGGRGGRSAGKPNFLDGDDSGAADLGGGIGVDRHPFERGDRLRGQDTEGTQGTGGRRAAGREGGSCR